MSKTIEILKFLRVSPEKKRLIQVRGKLFSAIDDIPDERVQHVVRQSIAEMVEMAGGVDQLIEGGYLEASAVPLSEFLDQPESLIEKETVQDPKETIAELKSKIDEVKSLPEDVSKPIPTLLPAETAFEEDLQQKEANLNSGSLLNRFRSLTGRTPDKPQSIVPKLDIAGQINEILQNNIERDRAYTGRQVELRSAPNGDLLFIVDGRSYDSVNDIQEESIANLFRAAIADWES